MTDTLEFEGGSISTGTLRAEDLAETFGFVLETIITTAKDAAEALALGEPSMPWPEAPLEQWREWRENPESLDDEALDELVIDLQDALNDVAPEGFYFGTAEGDGADFGFWQEVE